MTRPTWDEYFLNGAKWASSRSSCFRRKVGAVIVDRNHRVVITGYNDAPAGRPGCESCPRRNSGVDPGSSYDTGIGTCVAVHAEANALIHGDSLRFPGATIYVSEKPCDGCMKLIRGAGLSKIVWGNAKHGGEIDLEFMVN